MQERKRYGVDGYSSKIVVYGREAKEKKVGDNGNCGRVYLPPSWIGKKVLIIRLAKEEHQNDRQRNQIRKNF